MSIRRGHASALLLSSVFIAACVMPVDFWDEHTMTVHSVAGKPASLSATQIVNLAQATDVTAYLKAVTQVEIPVVQLRISNIQSDNQASRLSGSIAIADPSDPSWAPVMLTYTNAPVSEGGTIELIPAAADVPRLSAMLLAKKKFQEQDAATFDTQPAHFDITSRIHVVAQVDSSRL